MTAYDHLPFPSHRTVPIEMLKDVKVYYERVTVDHALTALRERIQEWDYMADPHGYCHERAELVALVRAAADALEARRLPNEDELADVAASVLHDHGPMRAFGEDRWTGALDDCPNGQIHRGVGRKLARAVLAHIKEKNER